MPLHRFLEQFQCSFAIPRLDDKAFKPLPLVIDGPLEVMRHVVDLHKHLVEVPVPVPVLSTAHSIHPFAPEFNHGHRIEPVQPVAHRFVADLDPALMQQVFDVARR